MHVEGWSPNSAHLDLRNVESEPGVDKLQVDERGRSDAFFPIFHLPHHECRLRGVVKHRAVTRIRCYQRLVTLGANQIGKFSI